MIPADKKPQPERLPLRLRRVLRSASVLGKKRSFAIENYGCSPVGSEPARVCRFSMRAVSISGVT